LLPRGILFVENIMEFEKGVRVLMLIGKYGYDRPITAEKISELTGVHPREVSSFVSSAVRLGVPIVSCTKGYFRFRTPDERQVYLDLERARLVALGRKLSDIKRASANADPGLFDDSGDPAGAEVPQVLPGQTFSRGQEAT
jgi:hypothetical protein